MSSLQSSERGLFAPSACYQPFLYERQHTSLQLCLLSLGWRSAWGSTRAMCTTSHWSWAWRLRLCRQASTHRGHDFQRMSFSVIRTLFLKDEPHFFSNLIAIFVDLGAAQGWYVKCLKQLDQTNPTLLSLPSCTSVMHVPKLGEAWAFHICKLKGKHFHTLNVISVGSAGAKYSS